MAPKPAGFQARPRPVPSATQRLALAQVLAESDRIAARGSGQVAEPDAPPRRAPRAEVVFLGPLPGFGAPWLTQYAHHLARERGGRVLMIHVDGPGADLELVGGAPDPLPRETSAPAAAPASQAPSLRLVGEESEAGPDPAAMPTSPTALAAALRRMMGDSARPLVAILLHLCDPGSPEGLRLTVSIPHWTILCGAYDSAVVGAYRQLRELFETATTASPEPSAIPRSVGVMVMGADEATSRAAAQKLSATAGGFLRTPVALTGWLKQMAPVTSRPAGRFVPDPEAEQPFGGQLLSLLDHLGIEDPEAREFAEPPHAAVVPEPPEPPESPEPPEVETLRDADSIVTVSAAEAAEREPSGPPTGERRGPARGARLSQAEAPKPAAAEPDLASFLTDPADAYAGAVALRARCPRHPKTQLLLDRRGRLHLLRRHERGSGETAEGLRAALMDLIEARAWVREHLELLRLSQPQLRFHATARPLLHLFTDDAKSATALVASLGKFVRLHLLQQAPGRPGEAGSWVCADLN
jgi:hypothetical protein